MTAEQQKQSNDIVEVKGKIGRIENHLELLKKAQIQSEEVHVENSKKLDTILATFTDSPYNANNGFVKRINAIEKIVDNHVLFWRILIGSISGGSILWVFVKIIIK